MFLFQMAGPESRFRQKDEMDKLSKSPSGQQAQKPAYTVTFTSQDKGFFTGKEVTATVSDKDKKPASGISFYINGKKYTSGADGSVKIGMSQDNKLDKAGTYKVDAPTDATYQLNSAALTVEVESSKKTPSKKDQAEKKAQADSKGQSEKKAKDYSDIKGEKLELVPLKDILWLSDFAKNMASGSGTIYEVEDLGDGRAWGKSTWNGIAKDVLGRMQDMGLISEDDANSLKDWINKPDEELSNTQKQQIAVFKLLFSYEGTRGAGKCGDLCDKLDGKELGDIISMMQEGQDEKGAARTAAQKEGGIVSLMGVTGGAKFWSNISLDISKEVPTESDDDGEGDKTLKYEQIVTDSQYANEPGVKIYNMLHAATAPDDPVQKARFTAASVRLMDYLKTNPEFSDMEEFNSLVQQKSGIYEKAEDFGNIPAVKAMLAMGVDIGKCKTADGKYYSVDAAFDAAQELVQANAGKKFYTQKPEENADNIALFGALSTYIGKKYATGQEPVRNDKDGFEKERTTLLLALEKAGWMKAAEEKFDGYDETAKIGDTKYYIQLTGDGRKLVDSLNAANIKVDVNDLIEDLFHNSNKGDDKGTAAFLANAPAILMISAKVLNANGSPSGAAIKLGLKTDSDTAAYINIAKELNKGGKTYTKQEYAAFDVGGSAKADYWSGIAKTVQVTQSEKQVDTQSANQQLDQASQAILLQVDRLLAIDNKGKPKLEEATKGSDIGDLTKALFFPPGTNFDGMKTAEDVKKAERTIANFNALRESIISKGSALKDASKIDKPMLLEWVNDYDTKSKVSDKGSSSTVQTGTKLTMQQVEDCIKTILQESLDAKDSLYSTVTNAPGTNIKRSDGDFEQLRAFLDKKGMEETSVNDIKKEKVLSWVQEYDAQKPAPTSKTSVTLPDGKQAVIHPLQTDLAQVPETGIESFDKFRASSEVVAAYAAILKDSGQEILNNVVDDLKTTGRNPKFKELASAEEAAALLHQLADSYKSSE